MAAPDVLLELDPDLLALILHHPCDPMHALDDRSASHVRAYCARVCLLVRTCKTLANRYGEEARTARIHCWYLCAPTLLKKDADGVKHLNDPQRLAMGFASDRIDVQLHCVQQGHKVSKKMVCSRTASSEAWYERTIHRYYFDGVVAGAGPYERARAYAREEDPSDVPCNGVYTWPRLLHRFPEAICPLSCGAFWSRSGSMQLPCDTDDVFEECTRSRIVALGPKLDERAVQRTEFVIVYVPKRLTVFAAVAGGRLRIAGDVGITRQMLKLGRHNFNESAAEWHAEAESRPRVCIELNGANVYWNELSVCAKENPALRFFGAVRARAPRAAKGRAAAALARAQGRCAESDSDSDA